MFKSKFIIQSLIIALMVLFSACSKKTDDTSAKDGDTKNPEFVNIDDNDLTESDADLQSVDYKEVYDKLSSKGEWIQVSTADLGMDKNGTAASDNEFQKSLFSFITGVKDVHAEDVNANFAFVWKPADNLGVSISNDQPAAYVPYSNGQWVNTDAGWYFKAPTPEEEIVHHYGRWAQTPGGDWVWVPGRVWSPAWVDWRQDDNNIAWAPVPPSYYIVDNTLPVPVIDDNRYVIVEKRYFVEPYVYKHYNNSFDRRVLRDWNRPEGIVVVNRSVCNRGPDVKFIEQVYGRPIEFVKIKHVKEYDRISYSENEFSVFTPGFKKVKYQEKVTNTYFQPKSFVKYDDVKEKFKKDKDDREKGNDNGKIEKNDVRDNKTMHGNDKKLGDDRDMHKDKDIKSHDKGNKDNGNKDKGNHDKGTKDNGNHDKGTHDKGTHDKGTHDKGTKDNGNHDKGTKDNGNKDKGHGKK